MTFFFSTGIVSITTPRLYTMGTLRAPLSLQKGILTKEDPLDKQQFLK
jgi:hypothetical protein